MVAIKEESIKLGQELGQGEFGSVLRGIYTDNKGKKVNASEPQSDIKVYFTSPEPLKKDHFNIQL